MYAVVIIHCATRESAITGLMTSEQGIQFSNSMEAS